MKCATAISVAAVLFASLTAAGPILARTNHEKITITLGFDAVESEFRQVEAMLGQKSKTGLSQPVFSASIDNDNVACQAFDMHGQATGTPVTKSAMVSYGWGNGVVLSSFKCTKNDNMKGNDATPDGSSDSGRHSSNKVGTATIQVENDTEESARQFDIRTDGSIFPFTIDATDMTLNTVEGVDPQKVKCQAYADSAATKKVGAPVAIGQNVDLRNKKGRPSTIKAFKCRSQ